MRLQTLRIPDREELNERLTSGRPSGSEKLAEAQRLYWRGEGEISPGEISPGTLSPEELSTGRTGAVLTLAPGAVLGLNTYFNSFSCEKWREYTGVESVRFLLTGRGRARVSLYYAWQDGEKVRKVPVAEAESDLSETRQTAMDFPEPPPGESEQPEAVRTEEGSLRTGPIRLAPYSQGSLYAVIRAVTACEITGGGWEADLRAANPVRMAVVMCTYKKEAYVRRNLAVLTELLEEKGEDGEHTLSAVCIVDNGRTLPDPRIPGVTVIPNRNTGGSGGFARGMKAVLDGEITAAGARERGTGDGKSNHAGEEFTHLLLMDDDVAIEPEAVRRTKAFLACEKEEYRTRLLGGAMLRLDYPYLQHEAGGVWNHGMIHSVHQGLDLRHMRNVLKNEQREKVRADYVAWWYCCIPLAYVRQHGLPMPFFLHCDDIEYSLRGKAEPIYLNGIAVWHEPFENKRYSATEYYDVRNMLFTNARHCPEYGRKEEAFGILYKIYANLIRYRYRDAELVLKAVEDFRKGEKWLREVDGEKLHEEIVGMGYRMEKLENLDKERSNNKNEIEINLYKTKNISIINKILLWKFNNIYYLIYCLFLPKKEYHIMFNEPIYNYCLKYQLILYDPIAKKGFKVKKDIIEETHLLYKTIKILLQPERKRK